jgi:hypothetical protein
MNAPSLESVEQESSVSAHTPWTSVYDERGVDSSLLRSLLALSPLERLQFMERQANETRKLNEYGRRARQAATGADR